jgi:poly-gamma-glutamate synthesis protein (capsule biosynthesis protein)
MADVTIALVGDLLVSRDDPESIFALCGPELRDADIAFGNLEGPVSDVGQPPETRATNAMRYVAGERMIAAHLAAGIDVVSMANNHSMNLGAEGLLRTIEVLDSHGIAHAGAGRNAEAAHSAAILERKEMRIAFLSYTSVAWPAFAATDSRPGMALVRATTAYEPDERIIEVPGAAPLIHTTPVKRDIEAMQADVRRARGEADVVVVAWHWGLSGMTGSSWRAGQVIDYQIEMGHAAIDAGADLIVGHHPHQLESIEVYNDKVIYYSLGNFAFEPGGGRNRQAMATAATRPPTTTAIATCTVREGRIVDAGYVPYMIKATGEPYPASPDEAQQILDELRRKSREFGTEFREQDGRVVVWQAQAALAAAP